MASYIPAIVWLIGALVCFIVLRKRGIKFSLAWNIVLVIAGPLAIPFAFLAKPNKADTVH